MRYEMLVAMNVTDPDQYTQYRQAMGPILSQYGGGFRYDFSVDKVLTSEPTHPVTRVFAIFFRDQQASDSFFTDPRYLAVKETFYTGAVAGHTVIAAYSID